MWNTINSHTTKHLNTSIMQYLKSCYVIILFFVSYLPIANSQVVLDWAGISGSNSIVGEDYSVTTDSSGNVYTVGIFYGNMDVDPGPNVFTLDNSAGDFFIQKLDSNGNFLWAIAFGDDTYGPDHGIKVAVDASNNVFVAGVTNGGDFDPSFFNVASVGAGGFIAKYDFNGNFLWANQVGNNCGDLTIDKDDNLILTGTFTNTFDFDFSLGVANRTAVSGEDIFILKVDNNGNYIWSKSMGGTYNDEGVAVTTDHTGNVLTGGYFYGTVDFDPGTGTDNRSAVLNPGGSLCAAAFIQKLDPNGNYLWTNVVTHRYNFHLRDIEVDQQGNVYSTGLFSLLSSTADLDPGSGVDLLYKTTNSAETYLQKIDSNGNFLWADQILSTVGGLGSWVFDLSVDPSGYAYIIGAISSPTDFDESANAYILTPLGTPSGINYPWEVYIKKINPNGGLVWAKTFGAEDDDYGYGIHVDDAYNIHFCGKVEEVVDFDPTTAVFPLNAQHRALFTAKLNQKGVYGKVFLDLNQSCADEAEGGVAGRLITINPGGIIVTTDEVGTWSINSLPVGNYTATIDTSGHWTTSCPITQSFTVSNSYGITNAPSFGIISTQPCPAPNLSIAAPFLRPGFSNQKIYFKVSNEYLATAPITNGHVIIELDSLLSVQSASTAFTPLGNNLYQVSIPDLQPNDYNDFTFQCSLSTNAILGQTLCLKMVLHPLDSCILDTITNTNIGIPCNTPYDQSHLNLQAHCNGMDSIFFTISNIGNGDMTCLSQVRLYLDGQLVSLDSIQLNSNQTTIWGFAGDGRTWRMEVDQHPQHPGNSQPSATIELCGNRDNWTSGFVNWFSPDDADPHVDIFCGVVRGAYDPNDKTGFPLGINSTNDILPNQDIEYLIRFQNTGTDTAFNIVIRDTLSTNFDIATVRSGASSHNYHFRIYGQRILEWTFPNIMLLDSNRNEPLSHGFIRFKVSQVPNLPLGTTLENSAGIYFDFNAPIITNTYAHTLDSLSTILNWVGEAVIDTSLCDSFVFNGMAYNQTGSYFHPVQNGSVDSLYILNVNILNTDTTIVVTICDNNYTLNGQTYTSSGIYTQTLTNVVGCDSTITLDLTINYSNSATISPVVCDSFSANGQTYFSSGIYIQNLTTTKGCDSTLTIDLTINYSSSKIIDTIACDSFNINGQTYTTTGVYTQALTNSAGCDSILTLNVTVRYKHYDTLSLSACDSITINGISYMTSGTYTQLLTTIEGCDSFLTIHLDVQYSSSSMLSITTCDSFSLNGQSYFATGIYQQIIPNAVGCDSVISLDLTINYSTPTTIIDSACGGYTYGGLTYTNSGVYIVPLTSHWGCDSSITLDLTIFNGSSSTLTDTACHFYTLNNQTYITSGIYTQTIANAVGCDSVITLNLTILNSSTTNLSSTTCDSFIYNGLAYYNSGIYTKTFTNSLGCDSIVTLNLTINNSIQQVIHQVACDSFAYNGQSYFATGVYIHNFTTSSGCDSVVTLDLVVNSSSTSTISLSACDSVVYNGQVYYNSGVYTHHLPNINGCDSIISLSVNINPSNQHNIIQISCDSFELNGQTYYSSGIYTQTLNSFTGCDSVITLDLTINYSAYTTLYHTACDSFVHNNQTYYASGIYSQLLSTTKGCDSTLTINLTIVASDTMNLVDTSCNSYTYNGQAYDSSGIYTIVLTNTVGCDSLITLDLTVYPVDLTITINGTTLESNELNASYQWVNCDSNFAPIVGATSQQFTPIQSGNYAVEIRKNTCVLRSNCYNVNVLSQTSKTSHGVDVKLFPNPTMGKVTLDLGVIYEQATIQIWSTSGQMLQEINSQEQQKVQLDISQYPSAVYFIAVNTGQSIHNLKLIKE